MQFSGPFKIDTQGVRENVFVDGHNERRIRDVLHIYRPAVVTIFLSSAESPPTKTFKNFD
jgi:hypothetical protein